MKILFFLTLIMYLSGILVFCIKRSNLLLMLLSLEFVMLALYFMVFLYLKIMLYSYFFNMLFISFSVCEGSLGLAVLVAMIRLFGNDYIMLFSLLW
uniref:NADH-ubiquinone oxidoreductase chain 4L n=1 Tax=Nitidulidae sp. BMNH 1274727 TaxID=1796524 RepID=A0A126TEJ0_9CUCU|nr:NADH dehydrogenase subunit 4L [Nitidulidae sp. BMNH 1274727]